MSKLVIKNNLKTEFNIEHKDGLPAIDLKSDNIAKVIETIDGLNNYETPYDGATVIVKDKDRGGLFIYDSSKIDEDNQGTNFKGWIRQYDGDYVYPEWFGAKGDGVTDDILAIQNMVNYFNNIKFLNKKYAISSTIKINRDENFNIIGSSDTSINAIDSFPHSKLIFFDLIDKNVDYINISSINFNGENIPNSEDGEANDCLYISANGKLNNVNIENCNFYTGERFEVAGSDSHIFVAGANKIIINNCNFIGAKDSAIYISGDTTETYGEDLIVTKCKFRYCNVSCITKRSFKNIFISNNFVEKCRYGFTQGEADEVKLPGKFVVISDNIIQECEVGIELRIQDGSVVSGNIIKNIGYVNNNNDIPTDAVGILIQGSSNCIINDNIINDINELITDKTINFIGIKINKIIYNDVTYSSEYNNIKNNIIISVGSVLYGYNEPEVSKNIFAYNRFKNTLSLAYGIYYDNVLLSSDDSNKFMYSNGDLSSYNFSITNDKKIGIGHKYPTRALHIAQTYANGSTPNSGTPGTALLVESSGKPVLNIIGSDGGRLTFGDSENSSVFYIDYDKNNNVLSINLPTSDPSITGALWNDSGTVKISAG